MEVDRLVPRSAPLKGTASSADRALADGSRAMVDAWQRHRFFEGFARGLLSGGRPTLLVLDDLQWCDQETMTWLTFVLAFAEDAPLLVVATVRSDELDDNREVAASVRSLRSAGLIADLSLNPLDASETGELAASMLGRRLVPSEEALLQAATGGYPLFVVEAARSLPESTNSARALPVNDLQGVLRRRLEQASPAAREVAGLAAAIGRDFDLNLLSEASDLNADSLVQAVDELWRRRILREQSGGYDFSHDLLRDAAYISVSPARRWLLHRRLAQGIEILHAGHVDDVAAQLAEQYERGGRPDRALVYFRRAAEAGAAVFANAEAVRNHRRCLALIENLPAGGTVTSWSWTRFRPCRRRSTRCRAIPHSCCSRHSRGQSPWPSAWDSGSCWYGAWLGCLPPGSSKDTTPSPTNWPAERSHWPKSTPISPHKRTSRTPARPLVSAC